MPTERFASRSAATRHRLSTSVKLWHGLGEPDDRNSLKRSQLAGARPDVAKDDAALPGRTRIADGRRSAVHGRRRGAVGGERGRARSARPLRADLMSFASHTLLRKVCPMATALPLRSQPSAALR